jgi:hypothetical protein
MRKSWFLAAILLSTHLALPQRTDTYTVPDTVPVGQVGGIVVDDQGHGIPAALIEEYSWDWKYMLASTRTDREGRFLLIPGAPVRIHYLRVSALGFDLLQVRVGQQQKAGKLRLRLRASS